MSLLNLALFAGQSTGDGPGLRSVIWVRGCERHCPDCATPYFWNMSKKQVSIEKIASRIFAQKGIEGVTLCGGEPFLQAAPLSELASLCHSNGLSIVTYTGFTLSELESVPDSEKLLKQTDILIDGPYKSKFPETQRHWVGSKNQIFHFLTSWYLPGIEDLQEGESIIRPRNNFRALFERL